jgi:hypothetical protein
VSPRIYSKNCILPCELGCSLEEDVVPSCPLEKTTGLDAKSSAHAAQPGQQFVGRSQLHWRTATEFFYWMFLL